MHGSVPGVEVGAASLAIGVTVAGRFRLVERLARGGLSTIYRAEGSACPAEPAAVKVLDPLFADIRRLRERFLREANLLKRLDGRSTPRLLARGESDGLPLFVMELIAGEVLSAQRSAPSVRRAVEIGIALLDALFPLHQRGVVHRDIKPAHVLLRADRSATILDLGTALSVGADCRKEPFGTPAYCAPEQADGARADVRSDLYSVGVVLYQLLAGRLPFDGDPIEQLNAHATAPPLPLAVTAPQTPSPVVAVVEVALQKDPRSRHASAIAMRDALRAAQKSVR